MNTEFGVSTDGYSNHKFNREMFCLPPQGTCATSSLPKEHQLHHGMQAL